MKTKTQTLLAATLCLLSLGAFATVLLKRQELKTEISTQTQALKTRQQRLATERSELSDACEQARKEGEKLKLRNQAAEAAYLKDKASLEKLQQDPQLKGLLWVAYTQSQSPELQQANTKATRRRIAEQYGALFEGLGLSAEKIKQCLALLTEQSFVNTDMSRAAKENGLPFNSREYTSLQTQESRRFQEEMTEILGETNYNRFKEYCERDMRTLQCLDLIQTPQGVEVSAPLTPQQKKETVAQLNQLSHQYMPNPAWEPENLESLETQTANYLKAVSLYAR